MHTKESGLLSLKDDHRVALSDQNRPEGKNIHLKQDLIKLCKGF